MNALTCRLVRAFIVGLVVLWLPHTARAAESGIVGTNVTHSTDEPKRYWTPERMKRAMQNRQLPILSSPPVLQATAPSEKDVRTSAPSGIGRGAVPQLPSLPPSRIDTQFACPVTRYDWVYDTDNQGFPQKTVGVLFFEDAAGTPMLCTASLVNKRLLLTAGHCVASGRGQWHKNFMWAPGYLDGTTPYGFAQGEYAMTLTPWFNNQNWAFDVAFLLVTEPKGDELGWLGFMAGGTPNGKVWRQNGYPATGPFDGQKLTINTSAFGARDCAFGNPCTIAVGSVLTPGSSGGPWIYEQDGGIFANGLNSHKRTNCDFNMYSPYFGQEAWNLFQNAIGRQ